MRQARSWVVGGKRLLHGETASQTDPVLQHEGGVEWRDRAEGCKGVDIGCQGVTGGQTWRQYVGEDTRGIECL